MDEVYSGVDSRASAELEKGPARSSHHPDRTHLTAHAKASPHPPSYNFATKKKGGKKKKKKSRHTTLSISPPRPRARKEKANLSFRRREDKNLSALRR